MLNAVDLLQLSLAIRPDINVVLKGSVSGTGDRQKIFRSCWVGRAWPDAMEGRRSDLSLVVGTDYQTEKSLMVGRINGVQTKIGDMQRYLGIVGDRRPVRFRNGCLNTPGIDARNFGHSVGIILPDGAVDRPTGVSSCSLPRFLNRRKQEANQGAYDCDDDEKFDQGESTRLGKGGMVQPEGKKSHDGSVVTIELFSRQQLNEFASIRSRGPTSKMKIARGGFFSAVDPRPSTAS